MGGKKGREGIVKERRGKQRGNYQKESRVEDIRFELFCFIPLVLALKSCPSVDNAAIKITYILVASAPQHASMNEFVKS